MFPRKFHLVLVVLLSASVSAGCASRFTAKPLAATSIVNNLEKKYSELTVQEIFANATDKVSRNGIMNELLILSDFYYEEFKAGFYAKNATIQATFDILSLGLSGAATIVSGGAQTILAGAATAVQGTQGKLNARFYVDKTTETLINAMDTIRASKKTVIVEKMANKRLAGYSIQEGVRDVLEYHAGGSIINALVKLSSDSGAEKKKAEIELQKTERRIANFVETPEGDQLGNLFMPDGLTPDPAGQQAIRTWMDANGLETTAVIDLIFSDSLATERQRAVNDLITNPTQ